MTIAAVAALTATTVVAVAPSAAAAQPQLKSWLPTSVSDAQLQYVSCGGNECLAIGIAHEDSSGWVIDTYVERRGGAWTETPLRLPAGDAPVGTAQVGYDQDVLSDISCGISDECAGLAIVAEGPQELTQSIARYSDGTWSWVQAVDAAGNPLDAENALTAVSCGGPSGCVGVGGELIETIPANGAASAVSVTAPTVSESPSYPSLDAVSCASDGTCAAGGIVKWYGQPDNVGDDPTYGDGWIETLSNGQWTGQLDPSPEFNYVNVESLSCTLGGSCLAEADGSNTDGLAGRSQHPGGNELISISDGDLSTAAGPPADGLSPSISGSGCTDGRCFATGSEYNFTTGENYIDKLFKGSWTIHSMTALQTTASCGYHGLCAGAGTLKHGSTTDAILRTRSTGAWRDIEPAIPADAVGGLSTADTNFTDASCMAGHCAAIGTYTTSAGTEGLLESFTS